MLVPNGWIRTGGVAWNLHYSNVASVVMQVRNPHAPEALESFPLIPQVWENGGIAGIGVGQNYLGMEVRAPIGAIAMIEQLILPAFRARLHPRVEQAVELPKVAKALTARGTGPVTSSRYDAARVRIAYTQAGRAMEEDFYTVVSYTGSPVVPGATLWQPQLLYSFRAPRGRLDAAAPLLQVMVSSVRPSLKWYAGYRHVFNLWIKGQMQSIQAAGALSRSISAGSGAITQQTSDAWGAQQQAYDRIYDAESDQIRGVESYDDPFGGAQVQLPSDYGHAWASANGDYVLSDDAAFDPNTGSVAQWRQLRPAK